jgi:predicted nucleic acid-binding protein
MFQLIRSQKRSRFWPEESTASNKNRGIKIPFQDLLIGATALHLGYAIVTGNPRQFKMIPSLVVEQL